MPPLPDVANVIRCRILFTVYGKENQGLRFFMGYSGSAPTVSNLLAFAGVLKAEADSALPSVMSEDCSLTGYILEDLSSATGSVGTLDDATVGLLTSTPVPPGSAVVASYEISRRYRGGHPRSYWPLGGGNELLSDGLWESSFITSCQSAIDDVIDALPGTIEGSTTITNQVNVSYYDGFTSVENPITHRYRNVPTLRATPVVDPVTSIVVRQYVGSLRRRRQKTSG